MCQTYISYKITQKKLSGTSPPTKKIELKPLLYFILEIKHKRTAIYWFPKKIRTLSVVLKS